MYKKIELNDLMQAISDGKQIYTLKRITEKTDFQTVLTADCLVIKEEDPEPEPVEQSSVPVAQDVQDKPKIAPRIDVGKLGALYRAGWEPKKIAEELGCSVVSVRNYIKKIDEGEL